MTRSGGLFSNGIRAPAYSATHDLKAQLQKNVEAELHCYVTDRFTPKCLRMRMWLHTHKHVSCTCIVLWYFQIYANTKYTHVCQKGLIWFYCRTWHVVTSTPKKTWFKSMALYIFGPAYNHKQIDVYMFMCKHVSKNKFVVVACFPNLTTYVRTCGERFQANWSHTLAGHVHCLLLQVVTTESYFGSSPQVDHKLGSGINQPFAVIPLLDHNLWAKIAKSFSRSKSMSSVGVRLNAALGHTAGLQAAPTAQQWEREPSERSSPDIQLRNLLWKPSLFGHMS